MPYNPLLGPHGPTNDTQNAEFIRHRHEKEMEAWRTTTAREAARKAVLAEFVANELEQRVNERLGLTAVAAGSKNTESGQEN
jgi:hypothetical protein